MEGNRKGGNHVRERRMRVAQAEVARLRGANPAEEMVCLIDGHGVGLLAGDHEGARQNEQTHKDSHRKEPTTPALLGSKAHTLGRGS